MYELNGLEHLHFLLKSFRVFVPFKQTITAHTHAIRCRHNIWAFLLCVCCWLLRVPKILSRTEWCSCFGWMPLCLFSSISHRNYCCSAIPFCVNSIFFFISSSSSFSCFRRMYSPLCVYYLVCRECWLLRSILALYVFFLAVPDSFCLADSPCNSTCRNVSATLSTNVHIFPLAPFAVL